MALAPHPAPAAAAIGPASGPTPPPAPGSAAEAQLAADAAARRVDQLAAQYTTLSAQANAAAADLARSFAVQAAADAAHTTNTVALARARAHRGATIRAVYADGGTLGLVMTVLTAPTPDDALWRIGTARRIEAGVLTRADQTIVDAAARAAGSASLLSAADAARVRLSQATTTLRDRTAQADAVLVQAQAELNRLTGQARRLKAAEEAARRLAAARAAAQAARLAAQQPAGAIGIPPEYEATYRSAATACAGMRWTLLAAVGQVESGHGRNNGPSSAGAIGPMQFMPATFALYAVDGNADGTTDAWDFRDAIPSAGRYLCSSGAKDGTADGVQRALFAYNHAQWYVDLVLSAEQAIIAAQGSGP